jgi:hypothetical protein
LASKLSKNWNDPNVSEADRRELAPIFFETRESAFATHAYERGTDPRRQKYFLIAVEASSQIKRHEFETRIIEQMLIPLAEVRSIYRIAASRRRLAELKIDDTEIRIIRTQPVQQVFHFSRKDPSFPFLKGDDLTKTINAVTDGIAPFRNDTAHADQRIDLLTVAHTPPGDKWSQERIIQVTADLIELANLAEDCLAKLRASP